MTPGRTMRRLWRWVLLAALAPACHDTPARGFREPEEKPLVVAVTEAAAADFVVDTVQSVRAPEVRFSALVRADPNHYIVIEALQTGFLITVRDEGHVQVGDTLLVIETRQETAARQYSQLAKVHGVWHPWRQLGQFVFIGSTLGVVEEDGYWLAIGFVPKLEATLVHEDDTASVRLSDVRVAMGSGRVEWVRFGGPRHRYSAEVAVEFETINEFAEPPGFADVIVMPEHSTDSMAAVVPRAIVQLAGRSAVFVPVGEERYELRWIDVGPAMKDLSTVPLGLRPGTPVVAHGLEVLFAAARDSLERRTQGSVADSID